MRGPSDDGAVAWVAREDVARVTAAVLSRPNDSCATYDLTGSEALTMMETAKRLSILVGRDLGYKPESVEEGRKWRSLLGAPEWEVETWLGSYQAIAAGELEQTSNNVLQITGTEPFSLEAYFAEYPHLLKSLNSSSIS